MMEDNSIPPDKLQIIQHPMNNNAKHCTVIANPGSGKTFTLEHKIRFHLSELPDYRGVIAISYTNKASKELERRALRNGIDKKGCFLGTIDSFVSTEIIRAFGKHLFGLPEEPITTIRLEDIEDENERYTYKSIENTPLNELPEEIMGNLGNLFVSGKIILEMYGILALYIVENSPACQRYLRTRYSHIMIDEYQDCDRWKHKIFLKLIDLGLYGVAVGDTNQAIFAFSGHDSRYLLELTNRDDFKAFSLESNHRSHPSIVNYSLQVISSDVSLLHTDEIRVHKKEIDGSEIGIARWLTKSIPYYQNMYEIANRNQITILVRDGMRTPELIEKNIDIPIKGIVKTDLDNISTAWGILFRKILFWLYSDEETKFDLVEEYLSLKFSEKRKITSIMRELQQIEDEIEQPSNALDSILRVAKIIFPHDENSRDLQKLETVIDDNYQLSAFKPADPNEVQMMTLHGSKGLGFDLLFHLNLYDWILPSYNAMKGNRDQYLQDLNLHYVGITRAKKCCVLCTSTKRHNSQGEIVDASPSSFLENNNVSNLRVAALM